MFEIVIMNHDILYLPKIIFNIYKCVHACIKKFMPIWAENDPSRVIDFSKISIPDTINLPFELLVRNENCKDSQNNIGYSCRPYLPPRG